MRAKFDMCKELIPWKMKRKLKNAVAKPSNSNEFIIRYARSIKEDDRRQFDKHYLHQRRLVFVSLMGLYLTWKQCPIPTLYSSIFILPLRSEWIYDPLRYQEDIETHFEASLFSDAAEREEFMELLKWKDAQGFVFWMLDEHEIETQPRDSLSLIHPTWHYVNRKLMTIYDPVMGKKYNPIHLDENWWQNDEEYVTKYDVKSETILSEFYFVTLKFKSIQEIIYQSNPNSFVPVISYQHKSDRRDRAKDIFNDFDDGDDVKNWWISNDYDPDEK